MLRPAILALTLAAALSACDHGFSPPDEPPAGVLIVEITYADPASWPPRSELRELLFVALRFVPRDTADFLQLNRMVFSDRLNFFVANQTVVLEDVPTGPYPYAGVAHRFGPGTFDWRPVGLVEDDGGVIVVAENETSFVSVTADFENPPTFPPPDVE